jgi:hypothetical protein
MGQEADLSDIVDLKPREVVSACPIMKTFWTKLELSAE